ncbi:MAG: ATP-binding protein [Propionibacteriaceae bacterium]|nr:ATP-binding protein [Propionibacteriaceae bacterium]
MELIAREEYLEWLEEWRDKDVIKVVTGVRRCGKSTLLRMFRDRLRAGGVDDEHIIAIDLEDLDNNALTGNPVVLYEHVMARLPSSGVAYVFIDEVQVVPQFEQAVASLGAKEKVDVYVTGSNASMLSSDLATRLTGRYVELSILPLSFAEWMSAQATHLSSLDAYRQFSQWGSFPLTVQLQNSPDSVGQYLSGVLDTIVTRDVAVRHRVGKMSMLLSVVDFMADNIGNLTSARRIADALTLKGRKVTVPTIDSYLDGLTASYLFYPVSRYDIRGKNRLDRIRKYYIVDPGLRTALLGRASPDHGRVLENIVFLELRRRHAKVYVGKLDATEVDFVVEWGQRTQYIQVAQTVADLATLQRELAPLRAIPDYNHRLLITLDPLPPQSHDGIDQVYAPDWLQQTSASELL